MVVAGRDGDAEAQAERREQGSYERNDTQRGEDLHRLSLSLIKRLVAHLLAYSRRHEWRRSRFRHLTGSTIQAAHYAALITIRSAWLAPGRCPRGSLLGLPA